MYKFKKLTTEKEFNEYSERLQIFEAEFYYPLGEQRFTIAHGNKEQSYFDFFKQFGQVNYFIVESDNKIIAAGVAILKNIRDNNENQKYWYLADFKITKDFRKKGILKFLTFKYFLSHYFKTNKMIAVNMSPINDNGLVKKVNTLFSWFSVNNSHLYFYEWDFNTFKDDIVKKNYIKDNYVLFTNNGLKDIVIKNEKQSLYHLVDKTYAENNYKDKIIPITNELFNKINSNSSFMFCTTKTESFYELQRNNIKHNYKSSFISHKININNCHFFSGEI
jgi:hypothetical protein